MSKRQRWQAQDSAQFSDEQYQHYILQGVSRTFALTIPQLPADLELVTGNAYLLCRITDTIEDDAALSSDHKLHFIRRFLAVLEGGDEGGNAVGFSSALLPLLGDACPEAELDLIRNVDRVVRMTRTFSPLQQQSLLRCVRQMAAGMAYYQEAENPFGLADMGELDRYCYHVAGVVGEMLAELFCDYSAAMAENQQQLMALSVHFGQGLQMTNILKDVREDMSRGVNWLPADLFTQRGVDLQDLPGVFSEQGFAEVIEELIAVAHGHLRKALEYTLLIPAREKGLRRFCLWAIGMAMLTLKKLNADCHYNNPVSTKISRASLKRIIVLSNMAVGQDVLIKGLFASLARGLPAPLELPLDAAGMALDCCVTGYE
jgi:4,4'-diapophytoene synthase